MSEDLVDEADALPTSSETEVLDAIKAFEASTGFALRVQITQDFRNWSERPSFDLYAQSVFEVWREKEPEIEKPFLLLVDLAAKRLTYETLPGIHHASGEEIRTQLLDSFIPHAGDGAFDQAILSSIAALEPVLNSLPLIVEQPVIASFDGEFAIAVTRHVLYHELAHALIREFQLPVLANEEVMADTFATSWIISQHYSEAPALILPRIESWMYEASEVSPRDYDFKSEHPLDIRRAYQTACLLYGADPAEWSEHVAWLEFPETDLADCSDTAPDQIAGWEAIIAPHLLPASERSERVEVIYGEGPMKSAMQASGMFDAFADEVRRFDWPEKITLHFDHCGEGAYWNRTNRLITLCDEYVQRFVDQGDAINPTNH
ncbi:DUF4344 domain-containing metallopeptidase [Cognatiyoonia sp. IB215182]|uniref:DUF4344 domain-containing metallopeptidase n=1 Tax=Cognatiyoonia sp. IB215182 TaxID=3097353 RepID=UPI002A0B1D9A|nr:DUF4344 domain-containing metallopeptidase [Cognatiyoonia sp. IB215182]MDX8352563.1 DUF4344 domain-containing metallopeptidase [Cognatiyoonia sp. IB215182]